MHSQCWSVLFVCSCLESSGRLCFFGCDQPSSRMVPVEDERCSTALFGCSRALTLPDNADKVTWGGWSAFAEKHSKQFLVCVFSVLMIEICFDFDNSDCCESAQKQFCVFVCLRFGVQTCLVKHCLCVYRPLSRRACVFNGHCPFRLIWWIRSLPKSKGLRTFRWDLCVEKVYRAQQRNKREFLSVNEKLIREK